MAVKIEALYKVVVTIKDQYYRANIFQRAQLNPLGC